jgi:anti-sigma factor RsiW
MDHETTRELLELAAVEPDGLDRLRAGDTPQAQAVAAHLAGCPACTDELARLERTAVLLRATLRELPEPNLKERTLDAVRASGVRRSVAPPEAAAPPVSIAGRQAATRGRGRTALGWIGTVAAAVVISVVATTLIVGARVDERIASQTDTIDALEAVTLATFQLSAQPDARRFALAGPGNGAYGQLIFSPSTSEVVVVATGLTPPAAGAEYRCWVEEAGDRERVGKMYFSGDLAYWVGPAPAVEGLVGDAIFGVSLVDASGTVDPQPVLESDP